MCVISVVTKGDCPKLMRNHKETFAKVIDVINLVDINSSNGDSISGEVHLVSVLHGIDSWILDSGDTTTHVFAQHWFADYK